MALGHPNFYRYDVKISGGKVPVDVAPDTKVGIMVQDPVQVFPQEDSLLSRKTLQQGDEEYFIKNRAWFGSTGKARMFVTIYEDQDES